MACTVSKTFWVLFHEPHAFDRYDTLWEIAKDLRLVRSASCKSSQNSMMVYFSPNVQLIIHSPPPLRTCLGVEEGSPSVAGSAAASWASKKDEEEDEAEVPLHKLVEEEGAELTDDETGIKKHQDNDGAGCGGGRELGGRSSTGDGDGDGDRDDGINDLRSLWANISLTVRLGSIYSTPGVFWN